VRQARLIAAPEARSPRVSSTLGHQGPVPAKAALVEPHHRPWPMAARPVEPAAAAARPARPAAAAARAPAPARAGRAAPAPPPAAAAPPPRPAPRRAGAPGPAAPPAATSPGLWPAPGRRQAQPRRPTGYQRDGINLALLLLRLEGQKPITASCCVTPSPAAGSSHLDNAAACSIGPRRVLTSGQAQLRPLQWSRSMAGLPGSRLRRCGVGCARVQRPPRIVGRALGVEHGGAAWNNCVVKGSRRSATAPMTALWGLLLRWTLSAGAQPLLHQAAAV